LRLLMAKHNAPYALIPHIDENSSRSERDYMCEQLLKEYRNRISSAKENQPVQLTKQEQDVIITNLLAKIVIASAMVTMILLILFT